MPDLATFPLRAHGQTFRWLVALRQLVGATFPTLVVATTDARQTAWTRLLDEVARSRGDAPLDACVVTWQALRDDASALERCGHRYPAIDDCQRPPPEVTTARTDGGPAARFHARSGPSASLDSSTSGDLGCLALQVSPMERSLLDIVGRHPFLPAESLATVLGWEVRRVRERRARLIRLGLVRLLGVGERRESSPEDLTELT